MKEEFLEDLEVFKIHNTNHIQELEVVKVRKMLDMALEGSQIILPMRELQAFQTHSRIVMEGRQVFKPHKPFPMED